MAAELLNRIAQDISGSFTHTPLVLCLCHELCLMKCLMACHLLLFFTLIAIRYLFKIKNYNR